MTQLFDFPSQRQQLRPKGTGSSRSPLRPRVDDDVLAKALEANHDISSHSRKIMQGVGDLVQERKQAQAAYERMFSEVAELALSLDERQSQLEKFATEMMTACQTLQQRVDVCIAQLQSLAERGGFPTAGDSTGDSGELRQMLAQVLAAIGQSHSSISGQLESLGASGLSAGVEDDDESVW